MTAWILGRHIHSSIRSFSHLFCRSVGQSVGPSVGPSICRSVGQAGGRCFFFFFFLYTREYTALSYVGISKLNVFFFSFSRRNLVVKNSAKKDHWYCTNILYNIHALSLDAINAIALSSCWWIMRTRRRNNFLRRSRARLMSLSSSFRESSI